ncbi:hypothetical protein TgHK011_005359 [Trichoderma gracile]|nr:hypothetical protein TgHK011_005359 [Trichoderma gracile]
MTDSTHQAGKSTPGSSSRELPRAPTRRGAVASRVWLGELSVMFRLLRFATPSYYRGHSVALRTQSLADGASDGRSNADWRSLTDERDRQSASSDVSYDWRKMGFAGIPIPAEERPQMLA